MGRARAQSSRSRESGFTLVEIMVAISILLIGVLGVVTMVSYANRSSATTGGRQNATNVMRRVIETARAVPYRNLKSTGLPATLQAQSPDLTDSTPSDATWTVQRAGYVYTLTASVCLVDDPADGYGAHATSDPAWCSDSSQTGTADRLPSDYKRMTTTATWSVGGQSKSMSQAGLVPSTGQGDLPSTTAITPATTTITARTTTSASFSATAVNSPARVAWTVDGQTICPPLTSACSGSGASWNFTWALGTPVLDLSSSTSPNYNMCIAGSYAYDGPHLVGARAYDSSGLTGDAATGQVNLNRCAPIPPPNFNSTGRDRNGPVDIEWTDNPEDDVIGYRVFRGTAVTSATQICPAIGTGFVQDTQQGQGWSCYDPSPPAYSGSAYYYGVYAYDTAPDGTERRGALSYINVNTGNRAPTVPSLPSATLNADGTVTLAWKVPTTQDLDSGDSIASFRVYRRGATATGAPAYADRRSDGYDAIDAFCTSATGGATCTYVDSNTGGVQHTYNVTSVDTHLRESAPTANLVK